MSTRRALAFSFMDRYSALLLNVGSSMLISRLLTPAEVGVFSVTMGLLIFITTLRDFGAGQYLLQERELTVARIRATWTVILGTGILSAIVVCIAAPAVASFYGDPRMIHIMWVIALNFAINPFGSLTYAWLMREMRFDALAMMRFASSLVGAATSVYLAWTGHGPISLAFGSLLSTIVNALMSARFRPHDFPWLPGARELRRVITFGGKVSANSLLNVAAGSAPELILGKIQSLTSAAFFSRSNGLAAMFHRLFMDAATSVTTPLFAKEAREIGDINATFISALSYVTTIGWSFFLGLAIMAQPTIRFLYGYQWDASIDPTRIVALAYLLGLPAALCPSALIAKGGVNVVLKTALGAAIVQLIAVATGALNGLSGAALGLLTSCLISTVAWTIVTHGILQFRWRDLGTTFLKSAVVAVVAAVGPLISVLCFGLRPESRAAPLATAAIAGLALFVAGLRVVKHPLLIEISGAYSRFASRPWRVRRG